MAAQGRPDFRGRSDGGSMRVSSSLCRALIACAAAAVGVVGGSALAQTTACYTYDGTGRLVEAEYSDGSQISYDLDRNDNRNGTAQSPSGAASCATPVAAVGPLAGGDLSSGTGAPPPPPPPPPTNNPPVAVFDSAAVQRFGSINLFVLANDSDPDGDTLSISSITSPTTGVALIINSGTAIQFSAGGATGSADFNYTLSDGNGGTATGYVSVEVLGGGGGGEEF